MSRYFLLALTLFVVLSCKVRHPATTEKLMEKTGLSWDQADAPHFRFFYEPGSWAEANLDAVKADAQASRERILEVIQRPDYSEEIRYFLVEKPKVMGKLVSHPEQYGASNAADMLVVAVANSDIQALGCHELFHVISSNTLGETPALWLVEGLAVYADGEWQGHDLHSLGHYLHKRGKTIPFEELFNNFERQDPMITFPVAGSLVRYLLDEFGTEKVLQVWVDGKPEKVLGKTPETLMNEWLAAIEQSDTEGISYLE